MNLPAVPAAVSSLAEHDRSAVQFHHVEVLEPARTKPNNVTLQSTSASSQSSRFCLSFSSAPLLLFDHFHFRLKMSRFPQILSTTYCWYSPHCFYELLNYFHQFLFYTSLIHQSVSWFNVIDIFLRAH